MNELGTCRVCMLCAERVQVIEVSGMCQGCVKDVSRMCQDCGSGGGRSVEPKSMLNRICYHWHIHAVRKCQRDTCHARVRDDSGMCQGCIRD